MFANVAKLRQTLILDVLCNTDSLSDVSDNAGLYHCEIEGGEEEIKEEQKDSSNKRCCWGFEFDGQ